MHELSIVMSILSIVQEQAEKSNAQVVEEIELDIGTLSGIEMDAFDFAWKQGVKHTRLEQAVKKINTIQAKAKCLECAVEFEVANYFDACPVCGEHLLAITQGKELKVKSLVVS
jgi:hydrogenase nickel incorporation protein HypA/HybF